MYHKLDGLPEVYRMATVNAMNKGVEKYLFIASSKSRTLFRVNEAKPEKLYYTTRGRTTTMAFIPDYKPIVARCDPSSSVGGGVVFTRPIENEPQPVSFRKRQRAEYIIPNDTRTPDVSWPAPNVTVKIRNPKKQRKLRPPIPRSPEFVPLCKSSSYQLLMRKRERVCVGD
jgi:hypothetical protein